MVLAILFLAKRRVGQQEISQVNSSTGLLGNGVCLLNALFRESQAQLLVTVLEKTISPRFTWLFDKPKRIKLDLTSFFDNGCMMLRAHMEDYMQKLLKQMSGCSSEILRDYVSKYIQGKESLRFFSYGSNMNESKFREDTRNCCYEFGLINVQKAVLQDYKRILGNDSKNHGLAFTIRPSERANVEGICHDVPLKGLRSFLKKEGVLLSQPNYELLTVSVQGEDQPVLTLKGLKPSRIEVLSYVEKSKVHSYVRATIEGALRWSVDSSDIQETRDKLEKELQGF